ncbi:hypothetical protein HQ533_03065 [Candidatus Woesearchaeota archaeon]|nr:hypothetical protein [Candidatus Woesearchaeota archaeon]
MKRICFLILIILINISLVQAICGDGFCDLSNENYDLCPEDCIEEDKLDRATTLVEQTEKCYAGDDLVPCPREEQSRILPLSLQKKYNDLFFLIPLITVVITLMLLFVFKTRIAGKTLKEYLWPIRYYVLGAILIAISQYVIGLKYNIPYFLNLTQALWALMIVFSLIKLIKTYGDFNISNVLVLGVLYSIIIHGLKVAIRYFFYFKPVWYLLDRFLYGSLLVMIIALITGPIFIYLKKKGVEI